MRKNSKIFGLIACSAVLAGAVTVGAANVNVAPAAAEGETTAVTFEVAQKAQVRYNTDEQGGGIRFAATVSKDYLTNTLSEYDTIKLVSSIDKKGNTSTAAKVEWVVKGTDSTYVDATTNTYYHAITFSDAELDVKAASAVELTATMWLEDGAGNAITETQSVTRSMRAVANAVYEQVDSDKQTELSDYFGTRYTAKNAFKELADDNAWVVDGGTVATSVYKGATPVGTDLALGETDNGSYALFDADNNVYNVSSVTYVTQAITTQEKARVAIKGHASTTNAETWGTDCYYALACDVGSLDPATNGVLTLYYPHAGLSTFDGTFDGNGHAIMMSTNLYGAFGNLGANAVIKNLKLDVVAVQTNDGCTGTQAGYGCIIGHKCDNNAKIENVYVKVEAGYRWLASKSGYTTAIEDFTIGNPRLVTTGSQMTDVIFEVKNKVVESTGSNRIFSGFLSAASVTAAKTDTFTSALTNVYLVSSTQKYLGTYILPTSSLDMRIYAANDTTLMESETAPNYKYQDTDSYRYETASAMAMAGATRVGNWSVSADGIAWSDVDCSEGHAYGETLTKEATCTEDGYTYQICSNCGGQTILTTTTATGHNYAVTDSKEATCTEDGYITETCSNCSDVVTTTIDGGHQFVDGQCEVCGEMAEVTVYGETVNFSTADGTLPVADICGSADAVITAAYQGDTKLTVTDNVITGLTVSSTEITETTITIYTAEAGYEVPVKACTKWITTTTEMNVVWGANASAVVEGVYALANDIGGLVDGTYGYKTTYYPTANNSTFNGTFDGNGHSVAMTSRLYGAFGKLGANAVIKNLKLDVVNMQSNSGSNYVNSMLASTATEGSRVENVYVKVNATYQWAHASNYKSVEDNILPRCNMIWDGVVSMKDVVFEIVNGIDATQTDMRNGIIAVMNETDAASRDYNAMMDNVYLISSSFKYILAFGNLATGSEYPKTANLDDGGSIGYYYNNAYRVYASNDTTLMTSDKLGENGEDETVSGTYVIDEEEKTLITECGDDFIGAQLVCANAYRYDNVSAMVEAEKTQVGNWSIAADGTVSWVNSGN